MRWPIRKKRPAVSQEVGTEVVQAVGVITARLRNYGMMLNALKTAASDDDSALQAFADDYGMDQVDPIRRIDVLRRALEIIEKDPHG